MAKEFKLPELGENIESAEVLSVLVKEGDTVEKDQGLIEIETDKATVEVPSEIEGKVTKVHVSEGDEVEVGQTIVSFEEEGEDKEEKKEKEEKAEAEDKEEKKKEEKEESDSSKKKEEKETEEKEDKDKKEEMKKKKEKKGNEVVEVKLPDLGENIESADILSVLVNEGDSLEKEQGIIEIETDKATVEVPSEISGTVKEVLVKEGDKAEVGQTIIKVETSEEVEEETEPEPEEKEEKEEIEKKEEKKKEEKEKKETGKEKEYKDRKGERRELKPEEKDEQPPIVKGAAPAAPSVRRIAREIGVNINEVPGSGPGGRITMDDVKSYSKKLHDKRSAGGMFTGVKAEKLPDFSKWGETEIEDMSKIRSKTAEHLSYAWATIPHVTQHDKADITGLEKNRKALSKQVEEEGGKLTVTSILAKILVEALKKFPQFNSSIDMEEKQIIYKKYFNIGIAVDTEHGLIVPVVKNADKKNLTEISVEITELAKKARDRKVSMDDLQGGSMTITNLGGIGGTNFTPVVNSPEVAILGVSRGSYEQVYDDGEFKTRMMLPVSLSYDHRIIDGADAARFLRWICEALENPMKIFL